MNRLIRSIPLVVLASTVAPAQVQTFTAPPGLDVVESSGLATRPFADGNTRLQCVSAENHGALRQIKRLELRRDGTSGAALLARAVNLAILMSHASFATASSIFASNYAAPPTTVVARKSFSLPDLSALPPAPPAPWALAFPFDSGMAFTYDGVRDLLWEFQCDGSTFDAYFLDGADYVLGGQGTYAPLGLLGCTTANGRFTIRGALPFTDGAGIAHVNTYAYGAPASAVSFLLIGASDLNIGGVLCSKWHSSGEVMIPLVADALGNIGNVGAPNAVSFPFPGAPLSLVLQYAALDLSQPLYPLALSDGRRADIVAHTPDVRVKSIWMVDPVTPPAAMAAGTPFASGMPVTRFAY